MLTAKTESGILISMGEQWQVDELKQLRKATTFYCPTCGSSVYLKLGTKKQWHFAHQNDSICHVELEAESPYHLKGKYLLYQWLMQQQIKVALEVYLPLIRQRPDLLFKYLGRLYALEFQCSSIEPFLLEKRTMGYYQIGITPIWVLGGNRLKRHGPITFTIKSFEWLTLRQPIDVERQITYFCPETSKWSTLQQITSYSSTRTIARIRESSLFDITLPQFLQRKQSEPLPIEQWLTLKKHWRYEPPHPYPSKGQRYFQQLLYQHRIPLAHFPIEAGWATPFHDFIETSPHIWQTILLLECLGNLPLHQAFSVQFISNWMRPLIKKNVFTLRKMPSVASYEKTIFSYLKWLETIGILQQPKNTSFFIRIKRLTLPKTIEEAQVLDLKLAQTLVNKESYMNS